MYFFIKNGVVFFLLIILLDVIPENIFFCDTTHEQVLKNWELFEKSECASKFKNVKIYPMVIDEEFFCFKPQVLDLVIACHNLHLVNDLEVCFLRILESLVPDGALIGKNSVGEKKN